MMVSNWRCTGCHCWRVIRCQKQWRHWGCHFQLWRHRGCQVTVTSLRVSLSTVTSLRVSLSTVTSPRVSGDSDVTEGVTFNCGGTESSLSQCQRVTVASSCVVRWHSQRFTLLFPVIFFVYCIFLFVCIFFFSVDAIPPLVNTGVYWNPSTTYRDIAIREIGINGRTDGWTDSRKT